MKLLDTMVFVSALNPFDKYHKQGMDYLRALRSAGDLHVPTSTLLEFDLVMRNSRYTENEILETWTALAPAIGARSIATTPTAHITASQLRSKGLSYFDSLITAFAKETDAIVITRDHEIAKYVGTAW